MEGEKKLHFAIQKQIEKQLDCDEQVMKVLIESLITMIQRDSTKRLNAFTYKLIMENLIKFLKGEIANCSQGISSYMPKFDHLTIEQVNLSKQMILEEQLEINGQNNALTMLNLAQQEEIEEGISKT